MISTTIDETKRRSLDELRQRYDNGSKILSEVSAEADRLVAAVAEKTEILRVLKREYNETERLIRDLTREAFVINEKCGSLNSSFARLHKEVESVDRQKAQLTRKKLHLDDEITDMELQNQQLTLSQDHKPLEEEHAALQVKVKEAEAAKQTISDEISAALSNSSLERDEIEPKLIAMNEQFLEVVDKRIAVQGRLGEIEAIVGELESSVKETEDRIAFLKAYKTLLKDRDSLKETVPALEAALDADTAALSKLKADRDRKQEENEAMSQTAEQKEKEAVLLEGEVAVYQETMQKLKDAQGKRDQSFDGLQQQIEQLMALFTRRAELEIMVRASPEGVKRVKEAASG